MVIKIIPVEKNKEYEIKIESVTSEGMGVGHVDGFCVFVKEAVTNDVVKALILKVKSGYAYAKITEIIKASEYRQTPECLAYSKCGGCQLMHIKYPYQLEIKREIINDALKRIGGFDAKVSHMIESENTLRYRNKMIFPIGKDKNQEAVCGFYKERSHDIVELSDCYLGSEINKEIIKTVMNFIKKYNISVYDEKNHKGIIRRIFLRSGYVTGEVMVVISANADKIPKCDELVENLRKISDDIKSIILNVNTKKTNFVLGDKNVVLYGKETITDYLCGIKYEISPNSFYQINPPQAEKLYEKAIELADISKDDSVMDIYCGIGTITLSAAKYAKNVIGIEIVEKAIENAKKNAIENNIKNAEFYASDASDIVPKLIEKGERPDIVILDPPRKGSDEATLSAILKAQPKRIVYVSCNPATLARDLSVLCDGGYRIDEVVGVDMFSQTFHVESCVKLSRN